MKLNENDLLTKYDIQGPMGKGLDIQKEGVHIAFTAGTGVLVFIDLVAHLIRKTLGQLPVEEDSQLSSSFKFELYVSFPNPEEAIGLEMC